MNEAREAREHEVTVLNMPPSRGSVRMSILPRMLLDKMQPDYEGLLRADSAGLWLAVFGSKRLSKLFDAANRTSAKVKKIAEFKDILDFGLMDDDTSKQDDRWWLTVLRKGKSCRYEFKSKSVFQAVGWLQTLRKLRDKPLIPVVAVLGETGVGKSLLCSQLAGLPPQNLHFKVDSTAKSVTSTTNMYLTHWLGKKEPGNEVIIIDTPGLSDSQHKDDANVVDMLNKLAELGGVNTFVVLFNSQDPRLRGPLEQMLSVFQRKFKKGFWEHCLNMFTRWYDDKVSRRRRPKEAADLEAEWNAELRERFPAIEAMLRVSKDLPCYFVDNDPLDEEEKEKTNLELRRFSVEARQNHLFDCRRTLADQRTVAALFEEQAIPEPARELGEFLRAKALEKKLPRLAEAGILTVDALNRLQDVHLTEFFGWSLEDCDNLRGAVSAGPVAPNFVVVNEFRGLDIPTEGLIESGLGAAELLELDDQEIRDILGLNVPQLLQYHAWREQILRQEPVTTKAIFPGAIVVRNEEVWDYDGSDAMFQDRYGPGMVLNWTDDIGNVHGTTRLPTNWTGNPRAFDAPILPGWCRVHWFASGFTNCYRIGNNGRHDLKFEVSEDLGIEQIQANNPLNCKFSLPSYGGSLSIADLRCTFGYRIGRSGAHWTRFDVRPDVCRMVGGFAPGDVIRMGSIESVCIGLQAFQDEVRLYFHLRVDDADGAGVFGSGRPEGANKIQTTRVREVKHGDMRCHGDTGPSNDQIVDVEERLQEDFPYVIGSTYEEQGMFDVRPEIIGVFAPGLTSGDQLGMPSPQGYTTFTVIGVSKNKDGKPRLYMHSDKMVGAGVWPRLHEDYPGRLTKISHTTLQAVKVEVNSFQAPSETELRRLRLRPTLEFPLGTNGERTAVFDVRPEVVGRLCGYKSGTVLHFRQPPNGAAAKNALTVIGIYEHPETKLPTVWFHKEGDRGAGIIPSFYQLRSALIADDDPRDLDELREELAEMPAEMELPSSLGLLMLLAAMRATSIGGDGQGPGAGGGGRDDDDDPEYHQFLDQARHRR